MRVNRNVIIHLERHIVMLHRFSRSELLMKQKLVRNFSISHGLGTAFTALALTVATNVHAQALRALPIWSAEEMKAQCDRGLADAATAVDGLKALDAKGDIKRTLLEFDALGGIIQDVASIAGLMMSTSPHASVRTEASNCSKKWNAYWTALYQDSDLFAKLPKQGGDAIDQKYLNDLRRRFESSGVQLDVSKQEMVRKIRKEINDLNLEFERTLRDNITKVAFTSDEVRGVPAQVLDKASRDEQGRYLLGFSYPEYIPFMDSADNDEAKKRYYIAFTNRGGARNVEILAELAVLRDQLAKVMGYTTYASMVTQDRMAANPQAVIAFLESVRKAAEPCEAKELDEIKAFMTAQGAKETLSRWNIAYRQAKLRQSRYQINQEELRAFFPTQASIEFSLDIASELYGVAFNRTTLPTWHESVTVWEVRRKGAMANDQPLGLIYLDLFPRAGKFTHAAAFPTRGVSRVLGRKPISVMVANFNDKGLNYSELRTLLHEFGHILHGVLSDTRYLGHAGTSVERDFVEAPSQMFEAWGQNEQTLKRLSDRCKPSCPTITGELVQRLEASRRFGQGIGYSGQRLLASFDMQLHDVKAGAKPDALEVWKQLQAETLLGYVEGTMFPSAFGHLAGGYAVGYYGYLWAEVIASDMRSAFRNNLMDTAVSSRYRDTILSRGSERRAQDMVSDFLGRAPSTAAFFSELNGK